MPFAPPIMQHGPSVEEQECYLAHDGNNQEIIDCLNAYRDERAMDMGWIMVGFLIIVLIISFGNMPKERRKL